MWVLLLNDMRSSKIEILTPVARAETKEALLAFLEREKVEGYRDGPWGKSYRKDGPLEWCNPPWMHMEDSHFQDVGTEEKWAQKARLRFREQVTNLPLV